jgi:hypothetical protein
MESKGGLELSEILFTQIAKYLPNLTSLILKSSGTLVLPETFTLQALLGSLPKLSHFWVDAVPNLSVENLKLHRAFHLQLTKQQLTLPDLLRYKELCPLLEITSKLSDAATKTLDYLKPAIIASNARTRS